MKYIRKYESVDSLNSLKKYLIVQLGIFDDIWILEIFDIGISIKLKKIYKLDSLIIKISNPIIHVLSLDKFYTKTKIIKQSDNLDEMIDYLNVIMDTNKYNL